MGCVLGKDAASGSEKKSRRKERKKEGEVAQSLPSRVMSRATKTGSGIGVGETNQVVEAVRTEVVVEGDRSKKESEDEHGSRRNRHRGGVTSGELRAGRKWKPRNELKIGSFPGGACAEQGMAGWPSWLSAVAGEAINGWIPKRADAFQKIDKIGQGTYSNVYKARDILSGKIVALKKVRFDNMEPESVKFMAREINILRRLDHPNIVKLEGLVTSRMTCSLYLVFEYMEHDLAGLAASPSVKFTEAQVKCYMTQLLSGLDHIHNRHVLHRDIKGSNLLLDNSGMLKIADFGLASTFDPNNKQPMTSRVVTLWYRAPELLMGATDYGVGVDLWSAGCILAEMLFGKPIMPGRTEVEQLHKIFKLCGSPPDDYWKKYKLPHATLFKPQQQYKRCITETFKDFPPSSFPLIDSLLALDPAARQTASASLKSEFFTSEPCACDPSSLPQYPPSKEMDAKLRDEESRRRGDRKVKANGPRKQRARDRSIKAFPGPEANAELQANIDRQRLITHANAKSKSEKFPPPHQDGALGFSFASPHHLDPEYRQLDTSFNTTIYPLKKAPISTWSGPLIDHDAIGNSRRKKTGTTMKDFQKGRNNNIKIK